MWPGGSPGPHLRGGLQAHTGGKVRGLARRGVLQAHTWGGVSRPIHSRFDDPGGRLRGLARRGSSGPQISRSARGSPGPYPGGGGLQAHTRGEGVSQHALRQTPPAPSRRLLLRAVRILPVCILVLMIKL